MYILNSFIAYLPRIFDIPIVLSAGSICICRKRNQTLKTGTSHEYNPLAEKLYSWSGMVETLAGTPQQAV